jgi:hypothetical protein
VFWITCKHFAEFPKIVLNGSNSLLRACTVQNLEINIQTDIKTVHTTYRQESVSKLLIALHEVKINYKNIFCVYHCVASSINFSSKIIEAS